MEWFILICAGCCETGFAFCLGKAKLAVGADWWAWMTGFVLLYILSAVLLAKAAQTIPIGVAYSVWTGIGAVGAVLLGIFVFHEPATFWRLFFLSTLILSIVGLKLVG
jgi:quaternary ammonium compound-resistance protein SugE